MTGKSKSKGSKNLSTFDPYTKAMESGSIYNEMHIIYKNGYADVLGEPGLDGGGGLGRREDAGDLNRDRDVAGAVEARDGHLDAGNVLEEVLNALTKTLNVRKGQKRDLEGKGVREGEVEASGGLPGSLDVLNGSVEA